MSKFQELYKKSHVQNHPWFTNRDKQVKAMRANMTRTSQSSGEEGGINLKDIFSQKRQLGLSSDVRTLNSFIQEAAIATRSTLDVLDFPILPQLNYNNAKYVKYSSYDPTQVVDAQILFNVRMATLTGSVRKAVIPVTVSAGTVVPPAIMIYDGRPVIIAQSTVDTIVQRNSSYAMEPLRGMFDPPLEATELDQKVLQRYEFGYQPREIDMDGNGVRRTYLRQAQVEEEVDDDEHGLQDGDIVIADSSKGYIVTVHGERYLDEVGSWSEAEALVSEWMDAENWYPNIWFANDHGNLSIINDFLLDKKGPGPHGTQEFGEFGTMDQVLKDDPFKGIRGGVRRTYRRNAQGSHDYIAVYQDQELDKGLIDKWVTEVNSDWYMDNVQWPTESFDSPEEAIEYAYELQERIKDAYDETWEIVTSDDLKKNQGPTGSGEFGEFGTMDDVLRDDPFKGIRAQFMDAVGDIARDVEIGMMEFNPNMTDYAGKSGDMEWMEAQRAYDNSDGTLEGFAAAISADPNLRALHSLDQAPAPGSESTGELPEFQQPIPTAVEVAQYYMDQGIGSSTPTTAGVDKDWEPTVKKMKDNPEIDNPWALANSMDNKGYTPGGEKGKDRGMSNGRDARSASRVPVLVRRVMAMSRKRRHAQANPNSIWAPFYEENLQKNVDQQVPIIVGPEEYDYIISPAGAMGEGFLVSIGDQEVIGNADSLEDAQEIIYSYSKENNHFSDVWSVTDDGQVDFVMSDTDVGHKRSENMPNMDPTVQHYYKMYQAAGHPMEEAIVMAKDMADKVGTGKNAQATDAESEAYNSVVNNQDALQQVQDIYAAGSGSTPMNATAIGQAAQTALGMQTSDANWAMVGQMLLDGNYVSGDVVQDDSSQYGWDASEPGAMLPEWEVNEGGGDKWSSVTSRVVRKVIR